MGSSGGDNKTVRFAPYLEASHERLVYREEQEVLAKWNDSPYQDEDVLLPETVFTGGLAIQSFPSVYDMFGKFMAGLDIEVLWTQAYQEMVNNPEIEEAIRVRGVELSDDMETIGLPRFETGMRDVNAVMSSSFVVGRGLMENQRTKELSKFAAELRLKAVDIAETRWENHLKWNLQVISQYTEMAKLFIAAYNDLETMKVDFLVKDKQWNFLCMEYWRASLSALGSGGGGIVPSGPSQAAKSVSGVMGGASMGASVGGPYGAVIGGVIGLVASFF